MIGNAAKNPRGAGLIIVIVILLVVGVVLAVFVSLINTESFSAMGQSAGFRAAGVADGGIEYALKNGTFPNYSFPPYSGRGPGQPLGDGSFIVDPPTVLTVVLNAVPPDPDPAPSISVVSTAGFADPALTGQDVMINIDSELIRCTGITATSFTNCDRGAGTPPTPRTAHAVDNGVYPATTLSAATPAGCGATTISVNPYAIPDSTVGFLPTGVLRVKNELMHYTGWDLNGNGAIIQFTGVTRCYKGTVGSNHPAGRAVFQHLITSTGTVPLPVIGNAQRVVRMTVEP